MPHNYILEYIREKKRAERAESLLAQLAEGHDLRRAEHVRSLGEKVKRLRAQVRAMQMKAEEHNRRAYATGLIVNCTGCDAGAPANADQLTEDRVREVESIACRLRAWWTNHDYRARRAAGERAAMVKVGPYVAPGGAEGQAR